MTRTNVTFKEATDIEAMPYSLRSTSFPRPMLFSHRWQSVLLAAASLAAFAAVPAFAQSSEPATPSGACFEVVRSSTGETGGAILVNRCNGKTWILIASKDGDSDRATYRWVPIQTAEAEPAPSPAPPRPTARRHAAARVRTAVTPRNDKCFTFNGHSYCE
jgi:hypothetical protein